MAAGAASEHGLLPPPQQPALPPWPDSSQRSDSTSLIQLSLCRSVVSGIVLAPPAVPAAAAGARVRACLEPSTRQQGGRRAEHELGALGPGHGAAAAGAHRLCGWKPYPKNPYSNPNNTILTLLRGLSVVPACGGQAPLHVAFVGRPGGGAGLALASACWGAATGSGLDVSVLTIGLPVGQQGAPGSGAVLGVAWRQCRVPLDARARLGAPRPCTHDIPLLARRTQCFCEVCQAAAPCRVPRLGARHPHRRKRLLMLSGPPERAA